MDLHGSGLPFMGLPLMDLTFVDLLFMDLHGFIFDYILSTYFKDAGYWGG